MDIDYPDPNVRRIQIDLDPNDSCPLLKCTYEADNRTDDPINSIRHMLNNPFIDGHGIGGNIPPIITDYSCCDFINNIIHENEPTFDMYAIVQEWNSRSEHGYNYYVCIDNDMLRHEIYYAKITDDITVYVSVKCTEEYGLHVSEIVIHRYICE